EREFCQSLTVRVTVSDPARRYVCDGFWAVDPEVPSPKVHCQLVTEPSGSLLWSLKLQASPVQLDVNAALGGWFGAVTCTVCDTGLELAFWLSLTVRVTV